MPALPEATTFEMRRPEIGISGSPSILMATRARRMVILPMAMSRNTGVRFDTASGASRRTSPSIR